MQVLEHLFIEEIRSGEGKIQGRIQSRPAINDNGCQSSVSWMRFINLSSINKSGIESPPSPQGMPRAKKGENMGMFTRVSQNLGTPLFPKGSLLGENLPLLGETSPCFIIDRTQVIMLFNNLKKEIQISDESVWYGE